MTELKYVESLSLCRCSVAPREVGEGLEVCELATGLRVVQLDEAAVAEQGGALCGEGVIAGHPHWLTPTTHTAQTPLVSAQQERERERERKAYTKEQCGKRQTPIYHNCTQFARLEAPFTLE